MEKKKIGKILRKNIWDFYCGDENKKSNCLCCGSDITYENFHCGHVVSEKDGGDITIENLRPICQNCNLSMQTNNMLVFMKNNKLDVSNNFYGFNNLKKTKKKIRVMEIIDADDEDVSTITEQLMSNQTNKIKEKSINQTKSEPISKLKKVANINEIDIKPNNVQKKVVTKYIKLIQNLPKRELKLICDIFDIKYLSRSTLKELQNLTDKINYKIYLEKVLKLCQHQILIKIVEHVNKTIIKKMNIDEDDDELIKNIIKQIINNEIQCYISNFGIYDKIKNTFEDKIEININEIENETEFNEIKNNEIDDINDVEYINDCDTVFIEEHEDIIKSLTKLELKMICDVYNIDYKVKDTLANLIQLIKDVKYEEYLRCMLSMCSKIILTKICDTNKISISGTKIKIINDIIERIIKGEITCFITHT